MEGVYMTDVNYLVDTEKAFNVFTDVGNVIEHASLNGEAMGMIIAVSFIFGMIIILFLLFFKFSLYRRS